MKYFDPYVKNSKGELKKAFFTLKKFKNKSGVYLIRNKKTKKIIYIGYSETQLYFTLYRHFQSWNDKAQERFVYDRKNHEVALILTTPKKAALIEAVLINRHKPKDNKLKYENQFTDKIEETANNWIEESEELPF